MKIVRLYKEGRETYGFLQNHRVATKEEITYATGVPLPPSVRDFLFDGWLKEISEKLTGVSFNEDLANFTILPPIPNPPKIICLAFNYTDHAKEQDSKISNEPVIFMKPRTALCGTNSDIICPGFVNQLDYEIELALVIGKECKNILEKDAMDVIFGYMILNDVSARDIQMKDGQFTREKVLIHLRPVAHG
jgi:2-keto-4-pentenoate hydratase/2-oxohepta-3-ene-1,7-dioic acid hydratase in catechol pathway